MNDNLFNINLVGTNGYRKTGFLSTMMQMFNAKKKFPSNMLPERQKIKKVIIFNK